MVPERMTTYRMLFLSVAALCGTVTPALAQAQGSTRASQQEAAQMGEYMLAKCGEFGWGLIALSLLAVTAVGLVAAWAVSRMLAHEQGTFKNTVRYTLYGVLLTVLVVAIAGGLCWFGISTGNAGVALVAFGLGCLALLIISFAIPMKVYDIGFFKALLFNVLVVVASSIGQAILGAVLPGPLDDLKGKSTEEQKKIVSQWRMEKREKELHAKFQTQPAAAPAPALPLPQRVQQLYVELQQARATLDTNDQAAVLAFNQRVAEYNALKMQLPPASVAATPAPAQSAKR